MKQLFLKIVPSYAFWPLIGLVIVELLAYSGTRMITANWHHHSPSLLLDQKIPLMPGFIIIYVGCYLYWIINYILCAHLGEDHFYAFAKAATLGYIIGAIIFMIYPTTIERPDVSELKGLTGFLIKFIYAADIPTNLFPSFHCLVSWYCWIAVRNCEGVPVWYQVFSLIFGILVCISTVAVKQHFVVDIVGGIAIAEITWLIVNIL